MIIHDIKRPNDWLIDRPFIKWQKKMIGENTKIGLDSEWVGWDWVEDWLTDWLVNYTTRINEE